MGEKESRGLGAGFSDPITVLVADPLPLVADALAKALDHYATLSVLNERPSTGLGTIEAVLARKPDVTLIDYWMPDMEGAAATHLIHAKQPHRKVIVLSWLHGTREIEASLHAGAVGFFPKTLSVDQVAEGIQRAQAGESPVFLEELELMFKAISKRSDHADELWKRMEGLSQRQLEILGLLSLNLSPKEVAKRLSISSQTVKVHIRNMLEKTGAHSYVDMITMARSCGLIRT